jgi:hypothetical protein
LTGNERIKSRLATEGSLTPWRRKAHELRKLVAGDYSSVDETAQPQADPESYNRDSWKIEAGYNDILVTDFESGTSNKMLQALKTLVLQSSFRFPDIEFNNAHPLEEAVNALYLKSRLGPKPKGCDAVPHMRKALWHYVVDGIGWVWCGVRDGKPVISAIDTMDVFWDMSVDLVTDMRWVACRCKDTLGYWVELYGKSKFEDMLPDDDDKRLEAVVELVYYYDVDGEKGTHAVYRCDSRGAKGEPIELVDNPHTMDSDGLDVPFLPLEPCFFLALPSVRNPVGIAELMVASQMALRRGDQYMDAIVDHGAPFISVEEGSYTDEELSKLEEGTPGEMITHKSGKTAAQVTQPTEIPATVFGRYQHFEQELYASSGANPYASGAKVDGIQYAAEVQAIQGNSSLTAATIAADHADHWRRVSAKCLANGAKFDKMPLVLVLDDDEMKFGPQNPIGEYLRPDADPIVAEDTMAFAPREKRIADANNLLNVAIEVKDLFPNGVKLAFEKFLQACGVRDTASYLEAPPPLMAPPGVVPPGTDAGAGGGLDAGASAAASTQ